MTRERLTMRFLADVWEVCRLNGGSVTGGCRTDKRNRAVGGTDGSKHTEEGGWGLACDLAFEAQGGRDASRRILQQQGWYTYIGPDYGPMRLHVQAFGYGIKPSEDAALALLERRG